MNEIVNLGNGQFVKVCMLKGQQGDNIQSIAKTSTNVLVDTYTITLTDGSTKTFTVTNGKGISSIEKTGTSGLVDTYTITYNDNTTSTFEVTNGNGISTIAKTSTAGLVDTYTITFTNGDTTTFTVTNGENGQDVSVSNLAPVESTSTASQSYAVGDHLVWNSIYYEVIQAIALGEAFQIDVNIQATTIDKYINRVTSYSTNETIIGKWIDGTNVYRKVVNIDSYTVQANRHSRIGLYSLPGDIKNIINISCTLKVGSSTAWKRVVPFMNFGDNDISTNFSLSDLRQMVSLGLVRWSANSTQILMYVANFESSAITFTDITLTIDYSKT